jgi:F-type H+-transporting ATPase subunit epsilon
MTIHLDIITPEGTVVCQDVDRVELPGSKGRFVVLKDHAPIVSSLVEGVIEYGEMPGSAGHDEKGSVQIRSGFVEVIDNHVTVCVELK